jgi:hypothetical protein
MRGVRRFELVVIAALVFSSPSLLQAFNGGVAVSTALLRFAAALLVCWAVGAIVERTLDNYARQARQKEISARIAQLRGHPYGPTGTSEIVTHPMNPGERRSVQ